MRVALVGPSGLVHNVVVLDWPPPGGSWDTGGLTAVSAERPDGSWRRVGPGCRWDGQRFLRPAIEAPAEVAVGAQADIVLRWLDEDGQPAAYTAPITLAIEGQQATYTPGADGSVTVPFLAEVAGEYVLQVVEPALWGTVLDARVVTVQ